MKDFMQGIDDAIKRATKKDNATEKYPYNIGSKVYQIFDTIKLKAYKS